MVVVSFDVIITTYRRPDYVVAAVKSCLNQGRQLGHVIVIDDASGDDTGRRIAEIGDKRVRYYQCDQNGGSFAARQVGLSLSDADWMIHLDDDWELLPGALDILALVADQAPKETVMIGARLVWDHGGESPLAVPDEPIDYIGQIKWRDRPDGLWMDNLCAVSRVARERVEWPRYRAGFLDTIFYLDVARHGMTVYTHHVLALQRTSITHSVSRGSAKERLARRRLDSPGVVVVGEELMARHGAVLKAYGPHLAAKVLSDEGMSHLLLRARIKAMKCACHALAIDMRNTQAWWIALFAILGTKAFEWAYMRRG